MIEWLSWLPYKSGFVNSNILETLKDRPNTPARLTLLEQRVHELDNVVERKRLRSGRVKKQVMQCSRKLFDFNKGDCGCVIV